MNLVLKFVLGGIVLGALIVTMLNFSQNTKESVTNLDFGSCTSSKYSEYEAECISPSQDLNPSDFTWSGCPESKPVLLDAYCPNKNHCCASSSVQKTCDTSSNTRKCVFNKCSVDCGEFGQFCDGKIQEGEKKDYAMTDDGNPDTEYHPYCLGKVGDQSKKLCSEEYPILLDNKVAYEDNGEKIYFSNFCGFDGNCCQRIG